MKKLTPARLTMLMFMVVGGLIAAYIAKGLLAVDGRPPAGPESRNVPMPVADLPAGTLITEAHLGIGPTLVKDMTRDILLQNKVIVGRITKEPLKGAHPIRSGQLYEKGVTPPLKVAKGMRAVSVDIRTTDVVDGLVKPNEFVDVHFTVTAGQDPRLRGGMTMTLFKGVKILAMNRLFLQSELANNGTNTITLELTPAQANILLVTREKGSLAFAYTPAGKGDGTVAVTGPDRVYLEEVLGLDPMPTPPQPFVMQIYRGTGRHEIEFRPKTNRVSEQSGGYRPIPVEPQQTPVNPNAPGLLYQVPGGLVPVPPNGGPSASTTPGSGTQPANNPGNTQDRQQPAGNAKTA